MTPGRTSPLTPAGLLAQFARLGYDPHPDGVDRPTIFGVRARSRQANSFDDCIGVIKPAGDVEFWTATTDPGLYWLQHPMRVEGTGILCPGQHKNAFYLGKHKGEYACPVQATALPVWRDRNLDGVLDTSGPVVMAGADSFIEIHHASENSTAVDRWSALCQVFAKIVDFDRFMLLIGRHDRYSYTLLDQWY